MATTNPVHQVLVTSGNQNILAAGQPVSALAVGQLGIFNYHTNISLGAASTPAETEQIYFAVGLNKTGAGGGATLEDINKSAGQVVQVKHAKSLTIKSAMDEVQKVIDIDGFKANCTTNYAIKVEFRNRENYMTNGYSAVTSTYNYTTGCCADPCVADCGDGDCIELAVGLRDAVNNDADGRLVATLYSELVPGVKVIEADPVAFKAANPTACLGIRLTGVAETRPASTGSINQKYHQTGTNFYVYLTQGFTCNGTAETIQEFIYSQGSGYDIRQLEYIAGGWNGKPGPYRTSAVTGLERGGYEFYANAASKYIVVDLTYDQFSVGGWLEYFNNLETIFAIPCADTGTLASLIGATDAIFTQFGAMTNDLAGVDCNGVEVHTINNPALDGIESLA